MNVPLWAWAAFGAVVVIMLADRPARPPRRPRHRLQGGRLVERALGRAVAGLRARRRPDARQRRRRRVHHRLAAREEPVGRQPVRLRADLRLLQGAARVPAPGAVLRRHRRAGLPRHLPRRRRRHRQPVHRRSCSSSPRSCSTAPTSCMKDEDDAYDPGKSVAVRLLRKVIPVRDEYAGTKFFVKEAGKRVATPLLAVVVAIEAADLVFAVDSVPAVLAVSDDAFIVYSSNAFAILGLRALYFLLAGLLEKFHYLSQGPGGHPRLHRREAGPAGRPQGDQHLDPGDPVAGQPRRDRRRAGRLDRAQPARPTARRSPPTTARPTAERGARCAAPDGDA